MEVFCPVLFLLFLMTICLKKLYCSLSMFFMFYYVLFCWLYHGLDKKYLFCTCEWASLRTLIIPNWRMAALSIFYAQHQTLNALCFISTQPYQWLYLLKEKSKIMSSLFLPCDYIKCPNFFPVIFYYLLPICF